ncbi:MAG: hypothetical protein FWH22_10925, partial [Fibromonadales bacterium]|nr:hypothetical protein [Fibromonadales bacterium]
PGRVLAGLSGVDLANSPENLKFTNAKLNNDMGQHTKKIRGSNPYASIDDSEIPGFIEANPDLPEETKNKMMEHYNNSKKSYEAKITKACYLSPFENPGFWQDTGIAAANTGVKMGLRQTLGFIMTEVWFAVKDALAEAADSFEAKLKAIAEGIKRGFINAKNNFKILIDKFGEGAISGVLSSLSTTLCNIFFTTAKNVVRVIRQTWASIVEAAKILIYNPDNLPFSERMMAALKIIATGASVVIGTVVQEAVNKALTPHIAAIPGLGGTVVDIVSVFAGTLCTGFLTVSLLHYLDSDPFDGFLTKQIDQTIAAYKRQAQLFAEYAAKLKELDIAKFEKETTLYYDLALRLESIDNDRDLNTMLKQAAKKIGVSMPWGDCSLDEFMKNKSLRLRFDA